ncbi:hypothetical protein CS022_13725 [Veronia nyctiphanis]|uniref:Uncharacterized protein n=1 Tax=Veronia nyctiphanis TaxID=1278244 RepID=A0A4Q0YQ63_9GAMM|nr:hypothetical protein [Veronia nyctiphanis]RXJ72695.1 hypothetical protein CS022_13725 [Veronia nyctiphanis]
MTTDVIMLCQFVAGCALLIGIMCYRVAKKKTQSPILSALIGGILSVCPLLGLLYLLVLIKRPDLPNLRQRLASHQSFPSR